MASIDLISKILNEKLDIDPAKVTADATFESLGLDSLDLVELVCELEETLDVDFGEPEGLKCVGDVAAYVDSLQK